MEVLYKLVEENLPLKVRFVSMLTGFWQLSFEKDPPNVQPLQLKGGSIQFNNISFGYHPDQLIFWNLTFSITASKKVAIVGPSSCGKSTIFHLLYQFYTPSSRQILIDGQDIHQVQLISLCKAIGMVPQDTPLFHADVLHNIRYGKLEVMDEEVKEAARKANVHATIEKLPDVYETKVGERGLMISGREKQRLVVARVMLKDLAILFFDEVVRAVSSFQVTLSRPCADLVS